MVVSYYPSFSSRFTLLPILLWLPPAACYKDRGPNGQKGDTREVSVGALARAFFAAHFSRLSALFKHRQQRTGRSPAR